MIKKYVAFYSLVTIIAFSLLGVGAVDWEAIACQINEKLKSHPVYFPTSIKLIPNE